MREIPKPKKTLSQRIGEGIDALIGIVSPKTAMQRQAYRNARAMLSTSFRGARKNRLNENWVTSSGSVDQDLLNELPTLRARSRDLVRNDPYATGIAETMTNNTVGCGIKPQSRIRSELLGISKEEAKEFQRKAEAIWDKWVQYADISDHIDFYDMQGLIDRQHIENGEAFVQVVMSKDSRRPYSLALNLIEADRVDTPYSMMSKKSVRSGIEIGEYGEAVKYYVRDAHPGDYLYNRGNYQKFITVDAKNKSGRKNILHLYLVKRPGQSRGYPFFAPVIERFQHLDSYLEAELVSARIAACFSVFITSPDIGSRMDALTGGTNSDNQKLNEIEPGLIQYLNPGENVDSFNPQRPSQSFEAFTMQLLRMIAASLNLPYELVTKDFTKSNYSNTRAALGQAYRYFRSRQNWMSKYFCHPVYSMLIEEAVLKGELKAPGFFKNKYEWCRANWIAEGWEWIDPKKEADSFIQAKDNNIMTAADIFATRGKDWEEEVEQIAIEKQKMKELEEKYGVDLSSGSEKKQINDGSDNEEEVEDEEDVVVTK